MKETHLFILQSKKHKNLDRQDPLDPFLLEELQERQKILKEEDQ